MPDGTAAADLPGGPGQPHSVVCHLGPTNSGKTRDALRFLAARGHGVYAAPLRMLAVEVFDRLSGLVGPSAVGLVTGEERRNPAARLLCATAELAPLSGDTLVLDEVHWAADPQRGAAWSRLLAFGAYRHVRLVGAPDAAPLLAAAFPDAEIRVHTRRAPLRWAGLTTLAGLPRSSLLVAFSRAAVIMLARDLGELRPGKVALLHGAMPPATRREQIGQFTSGAADLLVATDVVGHGINLPCTHVVFAESAKFDGRRRRPLEGWEVAQIAGRAGRFGDGEEGRVWALTGTSLHVDPCLLEASLEAPLPIPTAAGVAHGYRALTHGRIRPRLDELGCRTPTDLPDALRAWQVAYQTTGGWLVAEDLLPAADRAEVAAAAAAKLRLEDAWTLAHAPVDLPADTMLLARLARCLHDRDGASLADLVDLEVISRTGLRDAEAAARRAAVLRWYPLRFPGAGHITHAQAAHAEQAAARRVSARLPEAVARATFGRCVDCQQRCPPWWRRCDPCHQWARAAWEEAW